jgi:hypothetical protein
LTTDWGWLEECRASLSRSVQWNKESKRINDLKKVSKLLQVPSWAETASRYYLPKMESLCALDNFMLKFASYCIKLGKCTTCQQLRESILNGRMGKIAL